HEAARWGSSLLWRARDVGQRELHSTRAGGAATAEGVDLQHEPLQCIELARGQLDLADELGALRHVLDDPQRVVLRCAVVEGLARRRSPDVALGVVLRVERGEDRALAVSSRVVAAAAPEERLGFLVAMEPTSRIAEHA